MYTTVRHELRHARKAWPSTLVSPWLLSGREKASPRTSCYLLIELSLYTYLVVISFRINMCCFLLIVFLYSMAQASFHGENERRVCSVLLKHYLQVNLCTNRRDTILEIREISMLANVPNSTVPLQSFLCTGWSRINISYEQNYRKLYSRSLYFVLT